MNNDSLIDDIMQEIEGGSPQSFQKDGGRSQKQWVVKKLVENGSVSRNYCVQNYITRLGSIINKLKHDGWMFSTEYVKVGNGKDYKYTVVKRGME